MEGLEAGSLEGEIEEEPELGWKSMVLVLVLVLLAGLPSRSLDLRGNFL